jgi:hypothetical protein
VLFQNVGESLVRQFLDRRHAVASKLPELIEGVFVEGDQLAHASFGSRIVAACDSTAIGKICSAGTQGLCLGQKTRDGMLWQHIRSAFVTLVVGTIFENAAEETGDAFPGGCENGKARCHYGNDALEQDAAAARIKIGSRIRHAGDREIQQRETEQEIFHGAIHLRMIRVIMRMVNARCGSIT